MPNSESQISDSAAKNQKKIKDSYQAYLENLLGLTDEENKMWQQETFHVFEKFTSRSARHTTTERNWKCLHELIKYQIYQHMMIK